MDLTEEQNLFSQGYKVVGGLDEVGRGPLAGPVVAACVIITPEFVLKKEYALIKDSKMLNEKNREELYAIIMEDFPAVGIGCCDHNTIDKLNILQASFLAMKKAMGALKLKPDFIIIDGKFPIPNISLPQKPIISGDAKIFSIAAASIIAKVHRDRLMRSLDEQYPEYGFKKHKGYGTKAHLEKISEFGPCPIHRRSFAPVRKSILKNSV